jgi:glycosyltransferase involved in cell wall biosynthesis
MISIVTPTYNRRMFIPTLIDIYKEQTFSKEQMEWIIIDDGRDKVEDLFIEASKTIPNIRYIRLDKKIRLGEKRNMLNDEAKGEIIIAMDDDDYYPPDRVSSVVEAFKKNPTIELAGSSEMNLYYVQSKKIYTIGPYNNNHATNGTMAWRKSYSNKHRYHEYVTKAEETSFLDDYIHPMIQLNPLSTILVLCHTDNTVDKNNLFDQLQERDYTLDDLVKNNKIRDFYKTISA